MKSRTKFGHLRSIRTAKALPVPAVRIQPINAENLERINRISNGWQPPIDPGPFLQRKTAEQIEADESDICPTCEKVWLDWKRKLENMKYPKLVLKNPVAVLVMLLIIVPVAFWLDKVLPAFTKSEDARGLILFGVSTYIVVTTYLIGRLRFEVCVMDQVMRNIMEDIR